MPNAFIAGGVNDRFIPVTAFTDYAAYEFTIFNRWGQEIGPPASDTPWKGRRSNGATFLRVSMLVLCHSRWRQADLAARRHGDLPLGCRNDWRTGGSGRRLTFVHGTIGSIPKAAAGSRTAANGHHPRTSSSVKGSRTMTCCSFSPYPGASP